MDTIVANSENVRHRVQKYLGRDSIVIHPPCETDKFQWRGLGDFYLSAARLDSLKRVGMIIEAFGKMPDKKLVVISDGPERPRLERLARNLPNVEIKGLVSDDEYRKLMGECIATIYVPKDEDFGMTPVESMAAGKPVIGVAEGGLLETITHEQTGLLLQPVFGVDDLVDAVEKMSPAKAAGMREACECRAQQFDVTIFLNRMQEILYPT